MNDAQLLRYSRHIMLPQIDIEGQQALIDARALVVGAGGLGAPAAMYLAASGVGHLTLADGDTVDLTNLQRQIIHQTRSVGMNKAVSARNTLQALNPEIRVDIVPERLSGEALQQQIAQVDVVLDATDNFATRHAINRACVALGKPLVSGAAIRFDGQVTVFDLRREDSPCYYCLFPDSAETDELRCADSGVFSPLVGIIGAIQAAEAIKLLTGAGQPLTGKLMLLNALDMDWRTVRLGRDPGCPVCGTRHAAARHA